MSLLEELHERGPITVATFMELALYHPQVGYYARAARRTGRAGDFFTSVDVGPLFGELLEVQIAEMFQLLQGGHTGPPLRTSGVEAGPRTSGVEAGPRTSGVEAGPRTSGVGADPRVGPFDLVEAGAGNGRLAADILSAAKQRDPALYQALRLHLVEASARAREAQASTLEDVADRLASSSSSLPESFEGVLVANELLDAMPMHQVVMREDGLREVYVIARSADASRSTTSGTRGVSRAPLTLSEGPLSTPALKHYLDALDIQLEPGWRVEINLRAVAWMRDAARRLRRGFIVLIDYGHGARELYSAAHAAGTLTTFAAHRASGPERTPHEPAWLQHPGEQDITAHVDFTSVRAAADAEGMRTIAFLDQTYFLLGLSSCLPHQQLAISNRQFKTLVMPGGLGSTHKVMILGKGVGAPMLKGCSFSVRVT